MRVAAENKLSRSDLNNLGLWMGMDKDELIKKVQDPRYISGIYNYCDRWCERCIFTSRCLNYDSSEEEFGDLKDRDLNNKEFIERLHKTFQQTKEMITEMAEEMGVDLNSLDMEHEIENERKKREEIKQHELSMAAQKYSKMADTWLENEQTLFVEKQESLNDLQNIGVDEEKLINEADSINDALEVIRWYQYQIYIKIMRALNHDDEIEEDDAFPKDSDGSAKVALIGMDRSIGAWGRLQELFPEKINSILDILVHLDRLRRRTEKTFPNARSFVRPGFDMLN